jgi:hypothetical protein
MQACGVVDRAVFGNQKCMRPRIKISPTHFLLATLFALCASTFSLSFLPEQARQRVYSYLGVEAFPSFGDLNYVLAWLDCVRSGIPVTDKCPQAGYYFIYPKIFLLLLPTGLSEHDRLPMAVLVYCTFIVSMFAFLRSLNWAQTWYVVALLCAPPTLLALERCNVDLLILSLLTVATICLESGRAPVVALSAITVAALMKIYPLAALTGAVGRTRFLYLLMAALACVIGLGIQIEHLRFIEQHVLWLYSHAWGYPVAFMLLQGPLERRGLGWLLPNGIQHVLQIVALSVSAFLAFKITRKGCGPIEKMQHSAGMIIGSSIYSFCWILGPNFEYRYLMLLLTLPFLFKSADKVARPFTRTALALTLPMFWLSLFSDVTLVKLIQEAFGLALFWCLLPIVLVFGIQSLQLIEFASPGHSAPLAACRGEKEFRHRRTD